MEITIKVALDNAAFDEDVAGFGGTAIALADVLERADFEFIPGSIGHLFDSNGNTIGSWEVSE